MPNLTLPPEWAPAVAVAVREPASRPTTWFAFAIATRPEFDPDLPLKLHRWCLAANAGCDGERLLRITLCGFRLPLRHQTRLLARAGAELAWATVAVAVGLEAPVSSPELRVFGGGRLPDYTGRLAAELARAMANGPRDIPAARVPSPASSPAAPSVTPAPSSPGVRPSGPSMIALGPA